MFYFSVKNKDRGRRKPKADASLKYTSRGNDTNETLKLIKDSLRKADQKTGNNRRQQIWLMVNEGKHIKQTYFGVSPWSG